MTNLMNLDAVCIWPDFKVRRAGIGYRLSHESGQCRSVMNRFQKQLFPTSVLADHWTRIHGSIVSWWKLRALFILRNTILGILDIWKLFWFDLILVKKFFLFALSCWWLNQWAHMVDLGKQLRPGRLIISIPLIDHVFHDMVDQSDEPGALHLWDFFELSQVRDDLSPLRDLRLDFSKQIKRIRYV